MPDLSRLFVVSRFLAILLVGLCAFSARPVIARPVNFDLPAQSAAHALLAFTAQAEKEVLFPFDELNRARSNAVRGLYEPADALDQLLRGTGFSARGNERGKFVVVATSRPTGVIQGRLLTPTGQAATGIPVALSGTRLATVTDARGGYSFSPLPPGSYDVQVASPGFRTMVIAGVQVDDQRIVVLEPQVLQASDEPTRLEPFVVEGRSANLRPFDHSQTLGTPLRAAGNLDLPRSENGALPFIIYDRDQISRSGVVDLNEFLQRELLESDAATRPPGSGTSVNDFLSGSTNLNLRGFGADETVVLVNGRRIPELLVTGAQSFSPDVNLIPLSLVQQIDVLPVSASSLYTGNAVGGIINIVLRPEPDANATEVTTTYTNATGRYDAPQSSASLVHSHTLLGGRLRLRLHAGASASEPPTETELQHRQSRPSVQVPLTDALHRATPNIRSADGSPLFGPGTPSVTSVAPGANGTGGLAAFVGRQGMRNLSLFDSPGALSISPDSLDFPYGLRQRRQAYAGSLVYDPFPWLQVGIDGAWSHTVINRGMDVFRADLLLSANNALNPFGQDVHVSLNETAAARGDRYSEARIESGSAVIGLLLKLPAEWRAGLDAQYGRNVVRYRGLAGVDYDRWQNLVDTGRYNPLRDTQISPASSAFTDEVVLHLGGLNRFATLGDYETIDVAARVTNQALALPTGTGVLNLGADYRLNRLAPYTETLRYADGSLYDSPTRWTGRTLERYSFFGELQGSILPRSRLPAWVKALEADLAVRYVASANSRETNTAPTIGLRAETKSGLTFRGSVSTSSRIPTPQMTKRVDTGGGGGGGANFRTVFDPRRNETYDVRVNEDMNPVLSTEDSITQSAGMVFLHGKVHRMRAALDFVDTRKANEVIVLQPQAIADLEAVLPERLTRGPLAPGDSRPVGRITSVLTGAINTDTRHSQNWNASAAYTWTECGNGSLELHGRLVWYQRYDRRLFPGSTLVDELDSPDGLTSAVLKYRANLGAGWSNRSGGFGADAHYFNNRPLPAVEWASQGSTHIDDHWQIDAYVHADLQRWLPWKSSRWGLRGQVRVNNVFDTRFPAYANEGSGSGVQPYGDWRGRTYSLSLTASF